MINIDFETYCDLDIKEVGAFKYTAHPSCRILCLGYKLDDDKARVWVPGDPWPEYLAPENVAKHKLYAFSATFEYLAWNIVGVRDFPEYFKPVALGGFVDIRALCARYKMPQKLHDAAIALRCGNQKLATGTTLIRRCCTPGGNPSYTDFVDLYEYCRMDVETAREIVSKLPVDYLSPSEQKLWELTYRMNERGVPIDIDAVEAIIKYLAVYAASMKEVLPEITEGFITSPGQVLRIKQFCAAKGVELPNTQADTIAKFLKKTDLPEDVRTVLEVRQLTGMTSVKKFIKIKQLYNDGFVQGNLNYHGAGPGRWAGMGFQFHNLPRAKRKDPDKWIKRFLNSEPIDRPIEIAKALIRAMIEAPEGYQLILSDYSSIENRLLAWFSEDSYTLDLFRKGLSQYSDMAASLYGRKLEEIKKGSPEYQMGKVIILGCGYQMGWRKFQGVAEGYGIKLSDAEAQNIIKAYRAKYHLVVKTWKAFHQACKAAVQYPGHAFATRRVRFKVLTDRNSRPWLKITLPSKRGMLYANPKLVDGEYGAMISYWGFSSTYHQMITQYLTPGLITENVVQGTARDILAHGKLNIEENMPEVLLSISVHDEAGGMIRESDIHEDTFDKFNALLCDKEPWLGDMPLEGEGYIAKRYRKD